ncbi:MAG: hypothetical protein KGL39_59985 [Patescibacteria group bacterium]|nr:hypothetical protein [Patescibacteria group bacterium]
MKTRKTLKKNEMPITKSIYRKMEEKGDPRIQKIELLFEVEKLERLAVVLKQAMSQLHEMYHTPVESWRRNSELQQRKQVQMAASYDVAMTMWNKAHAAVYNAAS